MIILFCAMLQLDQEISRSDFVKRLEIHNFQTYFDRFVEHEQNQVLGVVLDTFLMMCNEVDQKNVSSVSKILVEFNFHTFFQNCFLFEKSTYKENVKKGGLYIHRQVVLNDRN